MSMTQQEIDMLPPAQRQKVQQVRQQILEGGGAIVQ